MQTDAQTQVLSLSERASEKTTAVRLSSLIIKKTDECDVHARLDFVLFRAVAAEIHPRPLSDRALGPLRAVNAVRDATAPKIVR